MMTTILTTKSGFYYAIDRNIETNFTKIVL